MREPNADEALLLRHAIPAPTHASGWLSAPMRLGLEEAVPSPPRLAKTLDLASRYDVSFYDAAYHALALTQDGLFVTADARYVKRVMKAGSVIELTDWQPSRTSKSRRRR